MVFVSKEAFVKSYLSNRFIIVHANLSVTHLNHKAQHKFVLSLSDLFHCHTLYVFG